ncbi:hypothetical protein PR048_008838 [Dryococelus australis]|uniref:Transcription regulator Myc N-terminal domain-containing protein n=1 Tax=Dryococelus australis TaxID=614101 RepID=A0ABQ9HY97_9NEOP|nr:hypothetical protein PR048_008838 [Dryococelus australis]
MGTAARTTAKLLRRRRKGGISTINHLGYNQRGQPRGNTPDQHAKVLNFTKTREFQRVMYKILYIKTISRFPIHLKGQRKCHSTGADGDPIFDKEDQHSRQSKEKRSQTALYRKHTKKDEKKSKQNKLTMEAETEEEIEVVTVEEKKKQQDNTSDNVNKTSKKIGYIAGAQITGNHPKSETNMGSLNNQNMQTQDKKLKILL